MKIKANLIRAAREFQANNKDVIFYLRGFNVTGKTVEATNGHVAITMNHNIKRAKKGIYNIVGRIPAKCYEVEFVIKKDISIVKFLCGLGGLLSVGIVEVIDGRFPNLQIKVLKELLASPIDNTIIPCMNADYVALASKAFKGLQFPTLDFEFRGEQKAVIVKLNGEFQNIEYGSPTVIIMPVRRST